VQVVIALIVTPEGFPLAYEVLPGNTADCTMLRLFLRRIEDRMSLALKRRLTLDAVARVTRIGRAEPQARRVSREQS
jgi:hypothetical protein